MKRFISAFLCAFVSALMSLCFTACEANEDFINSEINLEIDAVAGEWYSLSDPSTPRPGMYIRIEGTSNWKIYSQKKITGFTFEEGYYYKLVVVKSESNDKNMLGNSSTSYKLIKVIEKVPSESIRN